MFSEGILGTKSYELLNLLREKRNKIHDMGTVFSEKDLQEFSWAYSIVFYLSTAEEVDKIGENERYRIRESVEKWAEEVLKLVK